MESMIREEENGDSVNMKCAGCEFGIIVINKSHKPPSMVSLPIFIHIILLTILLVCNVLPPHDHGLLEQVSEVGHISFGHLCEFNLIGVNLLQSFAFANIAQKIRDRGRGTKVIVATRRNWRSWATAVRGSMSTLNSIIKMSSKKIEEGKEREM